MRFKGVCEQYYAGGIYGKDERGASVVQFKYALTDFGGLLKVGCDALYLEREMYERAVFWDSTYLDSLKAGRYDART